MVDRGDADGLPVGGASCPGVSTNLCCFCRVLICVVPLCLPIILMACIPRTNVSGLK